jgi:hypothetical protein
MAGEAVSVFNDVSAFEIGYLLGFINKAPMIAGSATGFDFKVAKCFFDIMENKKSIFFFKFP